MKRTLIAAAIASVLAFASVAHAQGTGGAKQPTESSVTLYVGSMLTSDFGETSTGEKVSVASGTSYAVALDFGIDHQTQWEIFYSYQKTKLYSGGFSTTANNLPLAIEYLHFGGTYFPQGLGGGGYVLGGFGLTLLQPDLAGLSSVTKPSLNLGGGYMIPIGNHLGVRIEARGYATLLNSTGGMFCSGGCTVSIKGTALYQGEVLVGLSGRF
jgi:hypothetical protein